MLEPIFVVPKNGLGNRFRAIASGLELANSCGRPLRILWEPYDGLPASWRDIFAPEIGLDFLDTNRHELSSGILEDVPLYLSKTSERISLRGHNLGEQRFARQFERLIRGHPELPAVVVAGDFFSARKPLFQSLEYSTRHSRRRFQGMLRFHEEIQELALNVRPNGDFLGLHLRGGDRRKEVPSERRLIARAISVARRHRISSVFICSDQKNLREVAIRELNRNGIDCFFETKTPDRRTLEGVRFGVADYINLRESTIVVGPKASTFSTEASVSHGSAMRHLLGRRRFFN